jgi:type VI secretion system protein ImpH
MGAQERQPHADLKAESSAAEPSREERIARVAKDARRFSFFQLAYVLERLHPGSVALGLSGPVASERVRFHADPSLIFASSDIARGEYRKDADGVERFHVYAHFLGLVGSVSPMPTHFVEKIALDNYQGGPQPVREFLDVIHHRLLSLVYRTWAKYRFSVTYQAKGRDPFTRRMFCTVGVDGFRDYDTPLDRFLFLRYAPIMASRSRSARGLEVVLQDLFGRMGVKLKQFVGRWTPIEKSQRNMLGVQNHVLGQSLTIGRWVYDASGQFNLELGPLGYEEYLSFLPGGHRRPLLRSVISTFTPGVHDVVLDLRVRTKDAPRLQLGSPRSSTIGRTAWLGGAAGGDFCISVPLEDKVPTDTATEEDEALGEAPPLPAL